MPNSIGAGILTGAVIGVLYLAVNTLSIASVGDHGGPLTIEGHPVTTLPIDLMGSLFAGGQGGLSSAFIVHAILRRVRRTGLIQYVSGGGCVALLYAGLLQVAGLGGPEKGWAIEIGFGLLSGGLYRLFAGAAPRSAE